MIPGTIMHLIKTVTPKGGGVIAAYKLSKGSFVRVLVLDGKECPTPAEEITMIDAAAEKAKENIRLACAVKG